MTIESRRDEIAEGLRTVRDRIAAAATSVGRDPGQVRLVVVTKTFPTSDIRLLAELGIVDVAENRHPEAADKAVELAELDLVWHFVGQVQSNKAARIAQYADVVHSVDSVRLAQRLGAGARDGVRTLTCLVQVNLDPPAAGAGRGGVPPDGLREVVEAVASTENLHFGGLMGVAPLGEPPMPAFERLADLARDIRVEHPSATMLSAGMSDDFPAAVMAGATHVRVGSAVLGRRPSLG